MKEKRFTQRLYETGERFLEDNETDCFYKIEESFGHVELLCERLNKIVDENEQLKQTIETQNFNYKNAKGIIHSSEHQIQRLQDKNDQLKQENQFLKNALKLDEITKEITERTR